MISPAGPVPVGFVPCPRCADGLILPCISCEGSGLVLCTHPAAALRNLRPAHHTAGPDAAMIADCSDCGATGVPVGSLVGREPQAVTARPSSPRSTWSTR